MVAHQVRAEFLIDVVQQASTQTFARPAGRFAIGSFFHGPAAPAFFQPLPYRGGLPIPTIVVEETDDGR